MSDDIAAELRSLLDDPGNFDTEHRDLLVASLAEIERLRELLASNLRGFSVPLT